jgi:hypothetical protein
LLRIGVKGSKPGKGQFAFVAPVVQLAIRIFSPKLVVSKKAH